MFRSRRFESAPFIFWERNKMKLKLFLAALAFSALAFAVQSCDSDKGEPKDDETTIDTVKQDSDQAQTNDLQRFQTPTPTEDNPAPEPDNLTGESEKIPVPNDQKTEQSAADKAKREVVYKIFVKIADYLDSEEYYKFYVDQFKKAAKDPATMNVKLNEAMNKKLDSKVAQYGKENGISTMTELQQYAAQFRTGDATPKEQELALRMFEGQVKTMKRMRDDPQLADIISDEEKQSLNMSIQMMEGMLQQMKTQMSK